MIIGPTAWVLFPTCRVGQQQQQQPQAAAGEKLDLDKERKVRTREEMAAEAAELRAYFASDTATGTT
jgi:hypothetical protein